jgi:hypothetical protein
MKDEMHKVLSVPYNDDKIRIIVLGMVHNDIYSESFQQINPFGQEWRE